MTYTKLQNMQKYIILQIQTYYVQANPLKTSTKINFELKNIVHWLRANKISLNTKKTEIVLFTGAQKTIIKKNMNFWISRQKINITKETKYLGMIMDEHLTFKNHMMDTVKLKLNRTNGLLAKALCESNIT